MHPKDAENRRRAALQICANATAIAMVRTFHDGDFDIFHFSSRIELTTPGIFSKTAPCSGRCQPAMASSLPMKQIRFDLNRVTTTTRQPELHAQIQRAIPGTALAGFIGLLGESTLLRFRHWLEKRQRADRILAATRDFLAAQVLLPKAATTMDGSLITVTSLARNTDKDRDPETHSVPKITQWHFGKTSFALLIQGMARYTLMQMYGCMRLKTESRPQNNGSKNLNEGETTMHGPRKVVTYSLI